METTVQTLPRKRHGTHEAAQYECDRQFYSRLRENELDLQTELSDLSEEILSREARMLDVLKLLRETRAQMRDCLARLPVTGACA